jgi:O-succinylbenzoate synthase
MERCLEHARKDATARRDCVTGINYFPKIQNHTLILHSTLTLDLIATLIPQIAESSHKIIAKWKISPATASAAGLILTEACTKFPNLHWRLDANSLFDLDGIKQFWNSLNPETKEKIEFIEDPCPYSRKVWNELESLGVKIAIDFEINRWKSTGFIDSPSDSGATTLILKPAIQNMNSWREWLRQYPHPFLVTSYLDHPVGLLHALWNAEELHSEFPSLMQTCGLSLSISTAELANYWPNLIQSEASAGNFWSGPMNSGIGFSSLLEKLAWQSLHMI